MTVRRPRWPKIAIGTFWFRVGVLLLLLGAARWGFHYMEAQGPFQPERHVLFRFLLASVLLILSPELLALLLWAVRLVIGSVGDLFDWLEDRERPHLADKAPPVPGGLRFALWCMRVIRWCLVVLIRTVTFPVRTYYNPTPSAVLSTLLIHWFLVGLAVWIVEQHYGPVRSGLEKAPLGESLATVLWSLAVFFINHSLDQIPLSPAAAKIALVGLVVFLFWIVMYAWAFREQRERWLHCRLRSKPRYLPLFGHYLVCGDLTSVRVLLHQLQLYGLRHDIVVVGDKASATTITGLKRLEHLVWALDGNLWDRETREEARIDTAAELVVLGANVRDGEAWRTVAAVEGHNQLVRSSVDARGEDDDIIQHLLGEELDKTRDQRRDLHLRWDLRRKGFRDSCRKIPYLATLIRELVSFRPRRRYPRHVNFTSHFLLANSRRRRWRRLARVVPVWAGPGLERSSLGIAGERRPFLGALDPRSWLRTRRPATSAVPPGPDTRKPIFRTALARTAHAAAAADSDPARRRTPAERARAEDLLADRRKADRELLDELCDYEDPVWNQAHSRILVEFHLPESAIAFKSICDRKHARMPVEVYSDLQLRVLWLSLCVLMEDEILNLLEAIWPANVDPEKPKPARLRFDIDPLSQDDPVFAQGRNAGAHRRIASFRAVLEHRLARGSSLVAYRPLSEHGTYGEWIPCAFGHQLLPGDQLLLLSPTGTRESAA